MRFEDFAVFRFKFVGFSATYTTLISVVGRDCEVFDTAWPRLYSSVLHLIVSLQSRNFKLQFKDCARDTFSPIQVEIFNLYFRTPDTFVDDGYASA